MVKTIDMLKQGAIDYEFRCTVVPGFVDEETVPQMGELVEGAKLFVFQQFTPGDTLDPAYNIKTPYTKKRVSQLADIMASYVDEVSLRV